MAVKFPISQSFQRITNKPLDPSFFFETMSDAQNYAYDSPISYEGQLIFIKDARTQAELIDNTIKSYSGYYYIGRDREICPMCNFTIDKINDLMYILNQVSYKKDVSEDLVELENELLKKTK